MPSFFIAEKALADTLVLKNGKEMKGLVVEQHVDRVILSTEKGEVPVLSKRIKKIIYDDAEQNFLQVGKAYEAEGKYGEALAYYEKAVQINPNLEEAKTLAAGVRNRFWASSTEGPRTEVETKQLLYDSWGQQKPMDELIQQKEVEQSKKLKEDLGIHLKKKGDWVEISEIDAKKDAWQAGLRRADRLASIDGQSLRYLNEDAVTKKMLTPRYSNYSLEYERDVALSKANGSSLKQLGLGLKLEYQGIRVSSVHKGSAAESAGLKNNDLVIKVGNEPTRYMPLGKVLSAIENANTAEALLTIRRNALLSRR